MAKSKAEQHLSIIHIQDEYGTKKDLYKKACEEFNINPEIDVCGSKINHVCENYITKEMDFFKCFVTEDFYMNAPYSEIYKFMERAFKVHSEKNVNALILTYAKTDTKFWHRFVEGKAEIHFIEGRLKFLDEYGNIRTYCSECKEGYSGLTHCPKCGQKINENSAPYPSCWIIYRKKDIGKPVYDKEIPLANAKDVKFEYNRSHNWPSIEKENKITC